ncbi:hypothetical protein HGM15179_011068 [Zosterops borbonicus]|uniref:Uncharacterized protein n=1 Tax=Zosterops borbonicus TaxID=364589 RepID=A0A8K1LJ91_9PASS|nr:hypothetical protein HGM15179_011068 [Zosterops borbonicus]
MPPACPRPQTGLPRPRPWASRCGLTSTQLWMYRQWRSWVGISAWAWDSIAALWLRLCRARPWPRPLLGPAKGTRGAAASTTSAVASPAQAPPCPGEQRGRQRAQEEEDEEEEEEDAQEEEKEKEEEEDRAGQGGRRAQPTASLGLQMAIKRVPRNRVRHWGELVSERGQREKSGCAGRG